MNTTVPSQNPVAVSCATFWLATANRCLTRACFALNNLVTLSAASSFFDEELEQHTSIKSREMHSRLRVLLWVLDGTLGFGPLVPDWFEIGILDTRMLKWLNRSNGSALIGYNIWPLHWNTKQPELVVEPACDPVSLSSAFLFPPPFSAAFKPSLTKSWILP